MTRLWYAFHCFFSNHRWEEMRVEGEMAWECRDCHMRSLEDLAPEPDPGAATTVESVEPFELKETWKR
jgi:hypothetical protein